MLIFIKTKAGATLSIDIEDTATIRDLKARIHERQDIPAVHQTLVYAGRPLEDSKSLPECGIKKESTLHLLVKVPEVAPPPPMESKSKKSVIPMSHSKSAIGSAEEHSSERPPAMPAAVPAAVPLLPSALSKAKADEILRSFAATATSSKVEVVFAFDSTGSMGAYVQQVKQKIQEISTRLIADIPKIRIGIINLGDYCDAKPIDVCDLTSNIKQLCDFVRKTALTGGGDSPEAYELALQVAARQISWSEDSSKALVMIGDDEPHPPQYTTESIDWKRETATLAKNGVKIYGVYCGARAQGFSEELAERTGALPIPFSDISIITDMFMAICYREASPQQLENFRAEMDQTGKTKNEAMVKMLNTLAQPNLQKKENGAEEENRNKKNRVGEWYHYPSSMKPSYTRSGERWVPVNHAAGYVPHVAAPVAYAAPAPAPAALHSSRRKSFISRLSFGIFN